MQYAIHPPIVMRLSRSLGCMTQELTARADIWLMGLRTRRHLSDLGARLLADIGLEERDRDRECAKWFWEA